MKNESPIFKIVPCVSIIRAVAFFLGKSMFVIFFSCYFTEIPEVVMQKNKYLHSFPNKESETAEGLNILGRKGGLELIEGCLVEHTLLVNLPSSGEGVIYPPPCSTENNTI